jgi:hypothetical protein
VWNFHPGLFPFLQDSDAVKQSFPGAEIPRERVLQIECPDGASAFSPRLARQRLPWQNGRQPQRGCGECGVIDETNVRSRIAVENVGWMMTQGNACRATLGFGAESRRIS